LNGLVHHAAADSPLFHTLDDPDAGKAMHNGSAVATATTVASTVVANGRQTVVAERLQQQEQEEEEEEEEEEEQHKSEKQKVCAKSKNIVHKKHTSSLSLSVCVCVSLSLSVCIHLSSLWFFLFMKLFFFLGSRFLLKCCRGREEGRAGSCSSRRKRQLIVLPSISKLN
jgi:Na+/glutamate symporter